MAGGGGIVQVAHAVHDFEKVAVSAVKELAQEPNADDSAVVFEGTVRQVQVLVVYEYFDAVVVDAVASDVEFAVALDAVAADVEFAVALDTEHAQAG